MKKNIITLLCTVVLLWACQDKMMSQEERAALREAMQARKPRRITDAELLQAASLRGEKIVTFDMNNPLPDSLQIALKKQYITTKERINMTEEKEKTIWEAYLYAFEQKQNLTPNVQLLPEQEAVLYTFPYIQEDSTLAMRCIIFEKSKLAVFVPKK
jgi:hypothetical protein